MTSKFLVGLIGAALFCSCDAQRKQSPASAITDEKQEVTRREKNDQDLNGSVPSSTETREDPAAGTGLFGMAPGDVLQRVDGETATVESPDQALELYTKFRGRKGLQVQVLRDGKSVTYQTDI